MRSHCRLLLIVSCLLKFSLFAAEPVSLPEAPPPLEAPSLTGTDREPVFPIEDLIGKPTKETDRFLSEFLNMLATLGLIIALILFIAWFLKRMVNAKIEGANASSSIKIIDRRNLSPKTMIYMIEVNGKGIIVAESQNGVANLGTYPPDEEEEEEETPQGKIPKPFSDLLTKTKGQGDRT
jgi:flagellar biogenesis protein FliO